MRGQVEANGLPPRPGLCYFATRRQSKDQRGSGMRINPSEGHPAMDYAEHQRTYGMFLKGAIYLIVGVVLIMAFLVIFVV